MSKFFTPIPVAVAETIASLPAGAHMSGLDWNPETKCLEVHWEHQEIVTPFTFPLAFSSDALATGELPEKAWRRPNRTVQPEPEPAEPVAGTVAFLAPEPAKTKRTPKRSKSEL